MEKCRTPVLSNAEVSWFFRDGSIDETKKELWNFNQKNCILHGRWIETPLFSAWGALGKRPNRGRISGCGVLILHFWVALTIPGFQKSKCKMFNVCKLK